MSVPSSGTDIPVIDIRALVAPEAEPTAIEEVSQQIGRACAEVGFFYIENHGVPEVDCDALLAEATRLFALPDEQKMALHIGGSTQFRGYVPPLGEVTAGKPDWHECIDLQPHWADGRPNWVPARPGQHPLDDAEQWPSGLSSFAPVAMRAWDQRWGLARRLAGAMAQSIGLPFDHFVPFEGVELCSLRMLHYPPTDAAPPPSDVDAGFGAHVDYGFLAVLQQDGVPGLEIRRSDGRWIPAPHVPGTFVVNIGLMMQRWTNDRFRATWHRARLASAHDRYTMPFFFEPRYDTVVEPLDVCCDADHPARYESCLFGEFVMGQFTTAYGERVATE